MKLIELQQDFTKLVHQSREILDKAQAEGRSLNDEERLKYDKMDDQLDKLQASIEQEKKLAEREKRLIEKGEQKIEEEISYDKAFRTWLALGKDAPAHVMEKVSKRGTSTQVVGTDSLGGYLVPDEWASAIDKKLLATGGMRQISRVITTNGGGTFRMPTIDDTAATASLITETTGETVNDITVGETTLGAYAYTSGLIKTSWE